MRLLLRGCLLDVVVGVVVVLLFVVTVTTIPPAAAEPEPVKDHDKVDKTALVDSLEDLYKIFKCEDDRPLQIHSDDDWKTMQSIYQEIVGPESSSLPPGGPLGITGFYVPIEVRMGDHGRGIYALEDIEENTLVWRSFLTARFESSAIYQRFLHALSQPSWACDVLMWAYTRLELNETGIDDEQEGQDDNDEGDDDDIRVVACVDLDPGSFVNGCDEAYDCNLKLWRDVSPRTSGCRIEFYAARHIRRGEELRIDYWFSERAPGWAELGLQKDVTPTLTLLKQQRGKKASHEEL
jgi:SET domain